MFQFRMKKQPLLSIEDQIGCPFCECLCISAKLSLSIVVVHSIMLQQLQKKKNSIDIRVRAQSQCISIGPPGQLTRTETAQLY